MKKLDLNFRADFHANHTLSIEFIIKLEEKVNEIVQWVNRSERLYTNKIKAQEGEIAWLRNRPPKGDQ